MSHINSSRAGSQVWKGVKNIWSKVQNDIFWQLGNENSIRFWEDRWLPGQIKLVEVVINNLPEEYLEVKVAEAITKDGRWNLDHFVSYLKSDMLLQFYTRDFMWMWRIPRVGGIPLMGTFLLDQRI